MLSAAARVQEFLMREGSERPDGSRDEPALDKFEAEIARHKATQEEVQVRFGCCERRLLVELVARVSMELTSPVALSGNMTGC